MKYDTKDIRQDSQQESKIQTMNNNYAQESRGGLTATNMVGSHATLFFPLQGEIAPTNSTTAVSLSCQPMFITGSQTSNAQVSARPQLSGVAADRILCIATNYELSRKCETALPLLFLIIIKCGDSDSCHLPSKEITERFGVHKNSCPNWIKKLSDEGVIMDTGRDGNQGVAIRLNVEMITGSGLFGEIREHIQKMTRMTAVMQQLNEYVVSGFSMNLEQMSKRVG